MTIERHQFGPDYEISESWAEFKVRCGAGRALGIIGGIDLDVASMTSLYSQLLWEIKLNSGSFAVVSGGTEGGIPEASVHAARLQGLPAVGVYPDVGGKHALLSDLDFKIKVPPPILGEVKWGSETPVLAGIADTYLLYGGSWGTMIEVSTIMKQNARSEAKGMPVKRLVVCEGSGGAADFVYELSHELGGENSISYVENVHEAAIEVISSFVRET